jgi:hypothetical protein
MADIDFRRKFREHLCCRVHFPELFTVASREHRDFTGGLGKRPPGSVHVLLEVGKLGEMFHMRCLLFHFLPQVLNRGEIWRIGRQLCNGQGIRMRREKLLPRLARVIPGPIVAHDDVLLGVRKHIEQKRRIAFSVEAPRLRLVEYLPGKRVNEPKDFVGWAFATGGPLRLLSSERPCVAQRAPLGQTGLIAKEQQGLALLGLPQTLGPPGLAPLQALGLIEVIGDEPGFLRRKAHMVEECRDRVGVGSDAKAALDQVLNHGGMPASRCLATVLRTSFAPLGELLALGCGALAGAPWWRLVHHPGHTVDEKRVAGIAHGLLPEIKPLGDLVDVLTLRES